MILRSLVERRARVEDPAQPLTSTVLLDALGGTPTYSGKNVTPENSLGVPAVYACVRLISETIASMPVDLIRKMGLDRREPVESDPYTELLAEHPNPEFDAGEFWRAIIGGMLLRGNGYAYTPIGPRGRATSLWALPPNRVNPVRTPSGTLAYQVRLDKDGLERPWDDIGELDVLLDSEIMHFRAFTLGTLGYSPIALARQAIGATMAVEQYAATFFANDARPGGYIKVPAALNDKQFERLKAQWNSLHQGAKNAHLMALLEQGAEWQQVGIAPEDAQFLETRKFGVSEVARLYGVPPHLIQEVERSTSWGTGIEQQGIGFQTYTLLPWTVRAERTVRRKLLFTVDRRMHMKFNAAALLRGDIGSRYAAYAIGRQWGWLNADDIRGKEDMDPIGGDAGNEYIRPMNYQPAGVLLDPGARSLDVALRDLVEQVVGERLALSNGHKEALNDRA